MKRHSLVLFAVLALLLVGLGAGGGARSPAARIVEIKGQAAIVDPENFDRQAALFGTLYANDRLKLEAKASVTRVFRSDGHIERLASPGPFTVTPEGCTPEADIERPALSAQSRSTVGKIAKGPRGIVQGGVVVARAPARPPKKEENARNDSDAAAAPLYAGAIRPVAGATILSAKPAFSWPAVPNATKYVLSLYYLGNRIWKAETDKTQLDYAGELPLKPGATYSWDVAALVGDLTAPINTSSFRIADDSQQSHAEAVRKMVAKPEAPLLAVAALWYEQNDLVEEAIDAYRQLSNLADDPVVYNALSGLCWRAGLEEEARRADEEAAKLEKKGEGRGARGPGHRVRGEG